MNKALPGCVLPPKLMVIMKYILTVFYLFIAVTMFSQEVEVIGVNELKDELNRQADSVYVVNFWATWCKPCTEEMPDLLKLEKEFSSDNMILTLISLDLPSMIDTRLEEFINNYNITVRVLLLDDPDANRWIPMVDESWSGSIPATLIYAPGKNYRNFHEGIITYAGLKQEIQHLIK